MRDKGPTVFGELPVKFAEIDENSTGSQEIVAAVTGKKIRVVSFFLVVSDAQTLTWQSSSTGLTGAMAFAANGGMATGSEMGLFETQEGEALNLLLGSAVQVSGAVSYVEVP